MNPIGICHTCFDEKFPIPRQPGLAPSSDGYLELYAPFNREEALNGLSDFSHIFIYWKSESVLTEDKLTVRPPRLGGNKKLGVFATRSPFRPNQICHSVVKLEEIADGKIFFSNHDILTGTEVFDIKPYIPEWDIVREANSGWLTPDENLACKVEFNESISIDKRLKSLIHELLRLTPQPRYKIDQKNDYAFKLKSHEIKASYDPNTGFFIDQVISLT